VPPTDLGGSVQHFSQVKADNGGVIR